MFSKEVLSEITHGRAMLGIAQDMIIWMVDDPNEDGIRGLIGA